MVEFETLEGILEFYSWILAAGILLFVGTIAFYYQKKFNKKTYYIIYLIPFVLLIISSLNTCLGSGVYIELVETTAATLSLIFTWHLYTIMMGSSQ